MEHQTGIFGGLTLRGRIFGCLEAASKARVHRAASCRVAYFRWAAQAEDQPAAATPRRDKGRARALELDTGKKSGRRPRFKIQGLNAVLPAMLHELLLSLSGHSSSLLDDDALPLAPAERELVRRLCQLSKLHADIRLRIQSHGRRDGNPICNAVLTAIETVHLRAFQQKILEVEEKILRKDSDTVGAYNIVPLASLVSEFDDWPRRLEWARKLVAFILEKHPEKPSTCSGASLINRLRDEALSGHPYIERTALELSKVAELAWLRQLSNWLLYGQIAPAGASDFFLSSDGGEYVARPEKLPKFVEPHALASIEFIGHSLSQIHSRDKINSTTTPEMDLIPAHQRILADIQLPISAARFSEAVESIRLSLSKNVLQKLLPVEQVLRLMRVFREFFLLGQGEFAVCLIRGADDQSSSRNRHIVAHKDYTQGLAVKQGELSMILRRTWSYLSPLFSDDEGLGDTLEMARNLLQLVVASRPKDGTRHHFLFNDLLLSIPTALTLTISSPFDLFLSKADIKIYSDLNSYLLSIRRGHIHLTELWKQSQLRRDHPSPMGPPRSCLPSAAGILKQHRERSLKRNFQMRRVWATSSAAIFLLSELCYHFEGQVIPQLWDELINWMENPKTEQSGGYTNDDTDPQSGAGRASPAPAPHDPASLCASHRTFLDSLTRALLLSDTTFVNALREFLRSIDDMRGHILRLQTIQRNMDLEEDEGVVDYMANNQQDLIRCESELDRSRKLVDMWSKQVVGRLKEFGDDDTPPLVTTQNTAHHFMPMMGPKIERLLMKLEYSTTEGLNESDD